MKGTLNCVACINGVAGRPHSRQYSCIGCLGTHMLPHLTHIDIRVNDTVIQATRAHGTPGVRTGTLLKHLEIDKRTGRRSPIQVRRTRGPSARMLRIPEGMSVIRVEGKTAASTQLLSVSPGNSEP